MCRGLLLPLAFIPTVALVVIGIIFITVADSHSTVQVIAKYLSRNFVQTQHCSYICQLITGNNITRPQNITVDDLPCTIPLDSIVTLCQSCQTTDIALHACNDQVHVGYILLGTGLSYGCCWIITCVTLPTLLSARVNALEAQTQQAPPLPVHDDTAPNISTRVVNLSTTEKAQNIKLARSKEGEVVVIINPT